MKGSEEVKHANSGYFCSVSGFRFLLFCWRFCPIPDFREPDIHSMCVFGLVCVYIYVCVSL